jgi:glycosyltransferase involved in cell wall biosynthesis
MVETLPVERPPLALFAFNRPGKLRRVLRALQDQGIPRLLVYVDGPRGPADEQEVQACRELARGVKWAETELHFSPENRGLAGLSRHVADVLERYPAAVFLEDDCLPVPGLYDFMRRALARYAGEPRVFSIGGYQPLPRAFFRGYPHALVSAARFNCWGWATWADRWQEAWPIIQDQSAVLDNLACLPEIAGCDLPLAIRQVQAGQTAASWDLPVALAALWLKKVHLAPVEGLVRSIGLDLSGAHASLTNLLRAALLHNRNVAHRAPREIAWLEDIRPNCEAIAGLRDFVARSQALSLRRQAERGRVLLRRYIWPRREALQDLHPAGAGGAQKRALLSYIVHPFLIPEDDRRRFNHTNIWHARAIVQVLNRMGYTVDVIDYRDLRPLPRRDYDLFIGHGGVNFERICRELAGTALPKILFTTGSHWRYHNQQEEMRFAALERRRGARLPLDRYIRHDEDAALRLADGVIGLGNQATRQTYAGLQRVILLNGTAVYDDHLDWCPKDFGESRAHFLFYAGPGNVHKGLDLLLEAFAGLPQHLWISTRLEAGFARLYRGELSGLPNIHPLGWVQPRSAEFYRMMRRCAFCILPSCSEGQSQSVIEAMNQGLIPLVSPQAGLDVQDFGMILEPVSVEVIRQAARTAAGWSSERCGELSAKARRAAQTVYSQAAFLENFQRALQELIGLP